MGDYFYVGFISAFDTGPEKAVPSRATISTMKYVIAAHSHPPCDLISTLLQSDSIDGATWAEVFRHDEAASS